VTHGDDHFQRDVLDLGRQIIQLRLAFRLKDGFVEVEERVGRERDLQWLGKLRQ
jgi:hypothetical protein